MTADESEPPRQTGWRPRLLRGASWLAVAGLLVAALLLWHGPLLTGLARLLIVDTAGGPPQAMLLLSGESLFDEAAQAIGQHSLTVVVIDERPQRLVEMGILPDWPSTVRSVLQHRHATPASFDTVEIPPGTLWTQARAMGDWLEARPDVRLTIVCNRFSSRHLYAAYAQSLAAETLQRIDWRAIPARDYDESNWWRSRAGCIDVFRSSVRVLFVLLLGEQPNTRVEWDPDAWARALLEQEAA